MDKFNLYAKYYDLLYKDKDYKAEVDYVNQLIVTNSAIPVKRILDLGCGTGKHDYLLSNQGYNLTGVDVSSEMIKVATDNFKSSVNLNFVPGDVRTVNLNKTFDAVISLFHVASYQTTNVDLNNYLETAFKHLKPEGLFIFDFWYGSAVLFDKPTNRTKTFENESLKVLRTSQSTLCTKTNTVHVDFDIQIYNKTNKSSSRIHESHVMRYLFLPEILNFAEQNGFSVLKASEWMSNSELSDTSWYGVVVLKKVK